MTAIDNDLTVAEATDLEQAPGDVTELVAGEALVEEVSIDGMCGVY